jgi:hypothetical protein
MKPFKQAKMKNIKQNVLIIILLGVIISCKSNDENNVPIFEETHNESYDNTDKLYEQFKVKYSLNENLLNISIITDLPDNIELSLSVNRSMWEKGDSESAYSIEYFSENMSVGELKNSRQIALNKDIWQSNLSKEQKRLALLNIDLEVEKISDSINIEAIVMSSNIPEPKFKDKKVGLNETFIYYPLKGNIITESEYGSFQSLKMGKTYLISAITPLMPELNPSDPIVAVAKMREIVKGNRIKILKIASKTNVPWYKVRVYDKENKSTGIGWINSYALLKQELYIIK